MCSTSQNLPLLPADQPRARPAEPQPVAVVCTTDSCSDSHSDLQQSVTDITPFYTDGEVLSESETAKHSVAENHKFLATGEISPALRVRLERYTLPQPQPMQKLHKDCGQCSKCPICMEGAPG